MLAKFVPALWERRVGSPNISADASVIGYARVSPVDQTLAAARCGSC